MTEWTPAKRTKIYALLAEGDLEGAAALVEPHVDLRQADFAPQDKKALKAFAAKAKGNRKIHDRLAGMIAHKSGTMRKLGMICVTSLDEFPVELIMDELRKLVFHMKTKRTDLQKGMMGGWPKEFGAIFEGLTKVAWRFPTDEVFLFPNEFGGPAKRAAKSAQVEAHEEGGLIFLIDTYAATEPEDDFQEKPSKLEDTHKPPDLITRVIGEIAAGEVFSLRDRWINGSGEGLFAARGFHGALGYLDDAAARFKGSAIRGIIEGMLNRILETESKKRTDKRSGNRYAFHEIMNIMTFSVENPNLVASIPKSPNVLHRVASKFQRLVEQGVGFVRTLKNAPEKMNSGDLVSFRDALDKLDSITETPRFNINDLLSIPYEPELTRQGWELYKSIPWREDLNQNHAALAQVILKVLKGHKDLDGITFDVILGIPTQPPVIPVQSPTPEAPAPSREARPILHREPPYMSASWSSQWLRDSLAHIKSLQDLQIFIISQEKLLPSPIWSVPSSKNSFNYPREDWKDERKILKRMTEKAFTEQDVDRLCDLYEQGPLNWLRMAECLPHIMRLNGGFGLVEAWEHELDARWHNDMRFVTRIIKNLPRKSFPRKMDLLLIRLGQLGAALVYCYLCCGASPDARMNQFIRDALPRQRPWTNFSGAVEQTSHILLRLVEFGGHIKPWWAETILNSATLLAEAESKLKGEALNTSYYASSGDRFLEYSAFYSLDLLRESGNAAPMREFMLGLSKMTFGRPDLYFLASKGWSRASDHKIAVELYYHYLGDEVIPGILLYLDRHTSGAFKESENWHMCLWNIFAHAVGKTPKTASDCLAVSRGWHRELVEYYLDHPKVADGIAARLIRHFEISPDSEKFDEYDLEWAFKHILANPKRIVPSGRTVLDLLKRGLWVNQPKFVKATIDRFERAVEAGAVEPEGAFHAIEEILTVTNATNMNAAIGLMKRLAKKSPGLALAKPNVVKDFIARDPEKHAKAFKGLV